MPARSTDKWLALWRQLFERARIDALLADNGIVDWSRPYREALIDDRYSTRLGEGSIAVATPGLKSPFTGKPITALPFRAKWLSGYGPRDDLRVAVDGSEVRVNGHKFSYTELGLHPGD